MIHCPLKAFSLVGISDNLAVDAASKGLSEAFKKLNR